MTTTRTDGGAAFPLTTAEDTVDVAPGMSLREWLAGQALGGLLAACQCSTEPLETAAHNRAVAAVCYADALLAELGRVK